MVWRPYDRARSPPDRLQANPEQPQAQEISGRLLQIRPKAEHAKEIHGGAPERPITDEQPQAALPETGVSGRHGHDPEPFRVTQFRVAIQHQHHTAENASQAEENHRHQRGDHHLPQQRRPVEEEKCPDTAESEDHHN